MRAHFTLAGNAEVNAHQPITSLSSGFSGDPIGILGLSRDPSLPPFDGTNSVALTVKDGRASKDLLTLYGRVERGTVLDVAQGKFAVASGAVIDGIVLLNQPDGGISFLVDDPGTDPIHGEGQIELMRGKVTAVLKKSQIPALRRIDVPLLVETAPLNSSTPVLAAELSPSGPPTSTIAYYSDVRLAAGSRVQVSPAGALLMSDLTLLGDARVNASNGATVGAIRAAETGHFVLTLSGSPTLTGIVQRTSPTDGVDLSFDGTIRLAQNPITLIGFNLNGSAIESRGSLIVDVDPGAGIIEQTAAGTIELNYGKSGASWGDALTFQIRANGSQLIGRADPTNESAPLVNHINAPILVDSGTRVTLAGRHSVDGTLPGTVYFSKVQLGAAAQLNLQADTHLLKIGHVTGDEGASIAIIGSQFSSTVQLYSIDTITAAPGGIDSVRVAANSQLTTGRLVASQIELEGTNSALILRNDNGTSAFGTLMIAGGNSPLGKLDLVNNSAVIDYTGTNPVDTVRQLIIAGRGGTGIGKGWTGTGITSSAAATDPETRSVGYAENATLPLGPYTQFRGQTVDSTTILIAYTRTGDANLDGLVNDDDVTIVSASYAPGVANASWALGDFDYNGFVDDDDVTLLGAFYDPSAPPLVVIESSAVATVGSVPEPSSLALLVAVAVILVFACCWGQPLRTALGRVSLDGAATVPVAV